MRFPVLGFAAGLAATAVVAVAGTAAVASLPLLLFFRAPVERAVGLGAWDLWAVLVAAVAATAAAAFWVVRAHGDEDEDESGGEDGPGGRVGRFDRVVHRLSRAVVYVLLLAVMVFDLLLPLWAFSTGAL
ncbi:hypothetical protein O4J56_12775 [Nocardiopsis sp. RSe5-2]|uniref:Uncharacterized protein n=1 Tax=Nocardiopsis endophytica TaxID=3018445 RepID=A0ABT4U3H9_9ACTN|nr:hypothetical protein [Nocardiopsis endophytica]MDA2811508.1 hypothetical protein [Nocardiopsis endophytica]